MGLPGLSPEICTGFAGRTSTSISLPPAFGSTKRRAGFVAFVPDPLRRIFVATNALIAATFRRPRGGPPSPASSDSSYGADRRARKRSARVRDRHYARRLRWPSRSVVPPAIPRLPWHARADPDRHAHGQPKRQHHRPALPQPKLLALPAGCIRQRPGMPCRRAHPRS